MPKAIAENRRKLTDAIVRAKLKPPKPVMIWDTVQRGFALRIEVTGRKAYKTVYSRHNRVRWVTLGATDAIGLADARQLAAEIMLDVARGKDPAAERRAARFTGTFSELAGRYVEEYSKRKNRSWIQADRLVRRNLVPAIGKLPAAEITRADIKAAIAKVESPAVQNQTLAAASAIFSWALREEIGGIKTNPCVGVERNETKSRERVLADSEIPRFWAEFDKHGAAGAALKAILLSVISSSGLWPIFEVVDARNAPE